MKSTAYGWLMLTGILLSLLLWLRVGRRDPRLIYIYFGALGGAFLGAKLVYLGAEGWLRWHDENRWLQFATGKSILGGLIGGYVGVEIAKSLIDYQKPTGDWFALVAPLTIMLGRVGCIVHGCCLGRACSPAWFTTNDPAGVARWPAALVEMLFNGVFLLVALALRRARILPGQHFHIYLMAYGAFRFAHEYLRETPVIAGGLSGYQIGALLVLSIGLGGFLRRRRHEQRGSILAADGEPSLVQRPTFRS
jgi:phosphatidylglycerol:prolipoprotein diacylglycerol transferase